MSNPITCIAIDDDPMSLKIIESLIDKTDFLKLLGVFENPMDALPLVDKTDLIFLDMEMPEMTGLELLGSLKNPPQIIIVSREKKYALESFEYEVTDYLIKPANPSRFLKAVLKVKRNLENRSGKDPVEKEQEALFIKVDSMLQNFVLKDILWIEAYGDYVKIKSKDRLHTVYSTMKNIESKLPEDLFVRVHRSYIINIQKIVNIDLTNLQIDDKIIPIGSNYKANLMSKIKIL